MRASVIITTYNEPEWLRKVLIGYSVQDTLDFELIIADDGSGEDTRAVVEEFKGSYPVPLTHVWHPDEGYQKCVILNKGILASNTEYLIFSDGDCIPRQDFVSTHLRLAERGYFLSGGLLRLPMELSQKITKDDIVSQRIFDREWMEQNGLPKSFKNSKLSKSKAYSSLMNAVTPTKASWNGHNSSGWKADALAVNGFNHDMHYGGQDREFGERLVNYGLKSKQIRYSAICVHLEHHRAYKTQTSISKNKGIRSETRKTKAIQTPNGINKLPT
ncbi:glycosyltransferase family 2 protein [Pontibacter mangrovi]|uniref:Glycosyltransferase n=1 Tax=Pontibacter mangrovi TaxID=2589816 RepID=A0A501W9P8_9BACT|nr:glycosyltransferase family 2 protein [Pontibacter mangrovi]TPE44001.1 glycosyltransferase [Pontibacter mangrovi]